MLPDRCMEDLVIRGRLKWPLNHRLVFLRADLAGKAFTSGSIVLAIPLLSDAQGFMAVYGLRTHQ